MKPKNSKRLALIGALIVPMMASAQDAVTASTAEPAAAAEVKVAEQPSMAATSAEKPTEGVVAPPAAEQAPPVPATEVAPAPAPETTPAVTLSEITPPPAVPATEAAVAAPSADASKAKDTLSVDFPDEDVRSILRNVADLFELNIVIPDTLQGRTSIKLRDVTWRQIFTVTISPLGYTFVEEGNIIKIISKGALDAEPFVTSSVILQNVAAATIDPVLRSLLTIAQPATPTSAPVLGGSLVLNSQNNEYIITDKPITVQRIIETAKRLDIEPRQVVIETKFVEVSAKDNFELSLKLEGRRLVDQNTAGGFNTLGQTPVLPAATLLSGPPTSPATFNAVLSASDYTSLLQALKTNGKTRLISNPTVVAVNGSKSQISVGREIQLVKKTENTGANNSGTASLEKDGTVFEGVKIDVTPQITSTKLVSLAVKAEKTIASVSPSGSAEQTFYDISKREATLNMLLIDGQTAAIGGLLDKKVEKATSKVPLLGDIPVLGNLFKSTKNSGDDTNLLIFITANILEPSKTSYKSVATPEQLFDLDLTERDIRGVSYDQSAEEARLMKNAQALRKAKQDAAVERKILNESKQK
jgi:type IV pilus assembly protein PilQ